MWPDVFTQLCSDLKDVYGLCDTYNMSANESVAMFLHICGHNITQRNAMHTFGHSAETISRKFYEILDLVILMGVDMFKQDPTVLMQVHPKLISYKHVYPYFKGFIGAIDGMHVPVMVSGRDQRRYWNRHGNTTMNVLAICDINMMFTYIYAGIPGSAHAAKVLSLAMEGDSNFPHPPDGKYYLGDSGYAMRRGFLCPYRGERYHISFTTRQQKETVERCLIVVIHHFDLLLRELLEYGKKWRIVRDEAKYDISTMRKIVVVTMTLHNFIRMLNFGDPDFHSQEEHVDEHVSNEEAPPNLMEQDLSSKQYMKAICDIIAKDIWKDCH